MKVSTLIKTIIITTTIIIAFAGVIVLESKFLQRHFGVKNEVLEQAAEIILEIKKKQNEVLSIENNSNLKDSIVTLILKRGEEEIDTFLIQVLNTTSGKLFIMTIPSNTRITMSNELYTKMQGEISLIPQMLTLNTLNEFVSGKKEEELAVELIEELLDIYLDSYVIISDSYFEQWFIETDFDREVVYQLSEKTKKNLLEPVTKRSMKLLLDKLYKDSSNSFSVPKEKILPYIEVYENLKNSDIIAELLPGELTNAAYLPDIMEAKRKIYESQKSLNSNK